MKTSVVLMETDDPIRLCKTYMLRARISGEHGEYIKDTPEMPTILTVSGTVSRILTKESEKSVTEYVIHELYWKMDKMIGKILQNLKKPYEGI